MTDYRGIPIRNIYYMLAYAFRTLRQNNYEEIAAEEFDRIEDMFAAILAKGISQQIKQGLYRRYVTRQEAATALKGKIDMAETIRLKLQHKNLLGCRYDDLSEDNIYNRIVKTTAMILLSSDAVKPERRRDLKRTMTYLATVSTVDPAHIAWNRLKTDRSNRTYTMLLNICYFVMSGMLQTSDDGRYRMASFSDERLCGLYERFVREYYKYHYPGLQAAASRVEWHISEHCDNTAKGLLPEMVTDITLTHGGKTLIIDTKYYSHTMTERFGKRKIRSDNLYQIYAYVKNRDRRHTGDVSGLLLYAKTDEQIAPDASFTMDGNRIGIRTLDLNCDFEEISGQLDRIVRETFDIAPHI